MKVLVFSIGADRYGLALTDIARVLPVATLKQVPLAPSYVAGIMDLHGQPVPVIDLSHLAGVPPEQIWFDTRIILVDYPLINGITAHLGLLAEHVTGIATLDAASLHDAGVTSAAFLGQVASTDGGMLQLVQVEHLLTPDVRALLFQSQAVA